MNGSLPRELRWWLSQLRPFRAVYLASLSCFIITAGLALCDPLIIKWIIDDILVERDAALVPVAVGAFLLVYLFRLGLNGMAGVLNPSPAPRAALGSRRRRLRHRQRLPARHHNQTAVGDTLYRLEQDVDQVHQLGGDFLQALVRIAVTTSLTVAIMMLLNWRLTLMVLPVAPCLLLLRRRG